MLFFTRLDVISDDIVAPRLSSPQVIIISCPAFLGTFHEMEKMLVREPQPVRFRTRWHIRFVPDQIVSQNPTAILHRDGEPGRNQEKLLFLAIFAHGCSPSLPFLGAESLASSVTNAGPTGEVRITEIYPKAALRLQRRRGSIENLNQMVDEPVWTWLKAQNST